MNIYSYLGNGWFHIVAVNDATNSKMVIYINGVQASTDSSCASAAMGSVARSYLVGSASVYSRANSINGANSLSAIAPGDSMTAGYLAELVRIGRDPAREAGHGDLQNVPIVGLVARAVVDFSPKLCAFPPSAVVFVCPLPHLGHLPQGVVRHRRPPPLLRRWVPL